MKMLSEIVADPMGNTLVKVTMKTEKGKTSIKTISLSDYLELLNGALKVKKGYFRIKPGFLPENYIDGYFSDEKNYACLWVEKAAVRQLVHSSGHYQIPFPDLIFSITVVDGAVRMKKVYALQEDGETLYQYPFGNVSTDGSICTGNIIIEGLEESVSAFSEEFFMGKTNNDYFHEGSHIVPKYTQEEMLRKLDGKKIFPKRWLKPTEGYYRSVNGLRKEIVSKCQAA